MKHTTFKQTKTKYNTFQQTKSLQNQHAHKKKNQSLPFCSPAELVTFA